MLISSCYHDTPNFRIASLYYNISKFFHNSNFCFFIFHSCSILQAAMEDTSPPRRETTPDGQQDYDVTRMREEDFERLAVYIVPDVPCERGTPGRADKTLPRSLTLKPSLALSTPNVKVRNHHHHHLYASHITYIIIIVLSSRRRLIKSILKH